MKTKDKAKVGGFTANTIIVPLSIILIVLIVAIAFLAINVNYTTSNLADLMQRSTDYQQLATQLQAGTSILSEIASGLVQSPVIPAGPYAGTLNTGPLLAYAEELGVDRRPQSIVAQFKEYGVNEEIQGYIESAAHCSMQIQSVQSHAISLIVSVYPFPENPAFNVIPLVDLTEEEQEMSDEERIAKARQMIFDKSYTQLKYEINETVETCHVAIQKQFSIATEESKRKIENLRIALWTMIALLITVLVATFVLFYRWIVIPLKQYSKNMTSNQTLTKRGYIKELRSMVYAYNELYERRNKLESILRAAAETDPLTGLPNRYHLEQTLLDFSKNESSLAVLLFDVNYLKRVNDTKGHLAGDQLLQQSAGVILECFGEDRSANCYRIGGDEFAVILLGCTEQEVQEKLQRFSETSQHEKISISVGYAFDEKADSYSFHRLMSIADKRMYEQKKKFHSVHATIDDCHF